MALNLALKQPGVRTTAIRLRPKEELNRLTGNVRGQGLGHLRHDANTQREQ